jgi:ABC-type bacteriocin/lantibiotic exporter with double-glycine peptidase domain
MARTRALRSAGALLTLVVTGCAGVGSESVRRDLLAGRSQGRYLAGVPFVPQADRYCGPASLAMVLRYWGEAVDQEEIGAALYLPSARGTLNLDLEFYARRRGFRAEGFRGTLAQVKAEIDHGRPVIVFQDQGIGPLAFPHFLVVIGYDDTRELVLAHSGVTENRLIPYREFLWTWGKTGNWTLRIQPPDRSSIPRGAPASQTGVVTGGWAHQRNVTDGREP